MACPGSYTTTTRRTQVANTQHLTYNSRKSPTIICPYRHIFQETVPGDMRFCKTLPHTPNTMPHTTEPGTGNTYTHIRGRNIPAPDVLY